MKFKTLKFRCHRLGDIMTNPRTKSETISETAKAYCTELFVHATYGRTKDIESKYLAKGLQVEEDSLTVFAQTEKRMVIKNDKNMNNEYITGTPDIIENGLVIDIKSSWDIFTFFNSRRPEKLNKSYYWQLQGYMDLTGAERALLAYALVDTPAPLIEAEKRKLGYKIGITPETYTQDFEDACNEIEKLYKYSDIPLSERCIKIEIERNQDDIDSMHERVVLCREWMESEFKTNKE